MDTSFQKNLKLIRASRLLSQEQIADALGLTRSSYTQYETGARHPDISILFSLSELYCININVLFLTEQQQFLNLISPQNKNKERRLLDVFRSLSDFSQGKVLERAESVWETEKQLIEERLQRKEPAIGLCL